MEKLQEQYGVVVRWRAFELRPQDAPPLPEAYRARIEAARPRLYEMARAQYGLTLNVGPFGVDSRPALVGAKVAEAAGVGAAYHAAVFRAYWQEGRSIAETAVLRDIAAGVGLAPEAFLAALPAAEWQAAVSADVAQAQALGITAVPALVFANRYLVVGAQPYDVLVQVTEQVQREGGSRHGKKEAS
ncbi:MAG: DsbA family protein [Anaerolineales bacterium]|nr:DsbA family protein [Anaerolineales bacterium]